MKIKFYFFHIPLGEFDWRVGYFNKPGKDYTLLLGYFYSEIGLEVTI